MSQVAVEVEQTSVQPARAAARAWAHGRRGPLLGAAAVLIGGWLLLSLLPPVHEWLRGDVAYYENWGSWLAGHRLPYRDFALEYPPGVLPVLAAPLYLRKLGGYHGDYDLWFRLCLLAFGLLALAVMAAILARLGASRRRAVAALLLGALAPALLGPVALGRYDYWPALLVAAGVWALVAGRGTLACALLAAGAVAKGFPVVVLPLALVDLWRTGRLRALLTGLGAALAVFAVGFAPYLATGRQGLDWALHRQEVRPPQVESLPSIVLVAVHELTGLHLHVVKGYGSDNLAGRSAHLLGALGEVALLAALILVYVLYASRPASAERAVAAAAAAVTAYVAFGKVFSPQYLVWLFPLVPLVGGRAGLRAGALFAAILGATQIWEPYRYFDFYSTFPAWLSWLVVARDVATVALFCLLTGALTRAAVGAGEPAAPPRRARAAVVPAVGAAAALLALPLYTLWLMGAGTSPGRIAGSLSVDPIATLHAGQRRIIAAGGVRAGDAISCQNNGLVVSARVPQAESRVSQHIPPEVNILEGGAAITLARRGDGSVAVRCGI